jgi:hypothetical protein
MLKKTLKKNILGDITLLTLINHYLFSFLYMVGLTIAYYT